jgi:hypothetical protein
MLLTSATRTHQAAGPVGQATAFANTFWWSHGFTAIAIIPALALPHQHNDPHPGD